jgi:DNA-binding CsgD family transcriptional regulator
MIAGLVSRSTEDRSIADFLARAQVRPAGLILEGEAGIGKTTQWLLGIEAARERGFQVLSARVGQAESVLAYATVADLFGAVPPAMFVDLPDLQRLAVDRVLFRAGSDGPATDQWVVAAAFVALVETLAADAPVLLAVDDVQWLDPSSKAVVAFAVRRLRGRVGVVVTERCDLDKGSAMSWLHVGRPDEAIRIRLGPLSLGGLHTLVSARLRRSFSRPSMVRITEISGGNPFYALELARAMDGQSPKAEVRLPSSLAELVRLRIGRLHADVSDVLLAIACVADPTLELLARVGDTTVQRIVELLEPVEDDGIVSIDGDRVRFSHPLLARGVYTDAAPGRRRAIHRALATIEFQPELQARHLALATTSPDDKTLKALDAAADGARARGAPAAAAELVELAIGLGGDKPWRRVRAAGDHFQAGETSRAQALLVPTIDELKPGPLRAIALNLLAAIRIYDNRFVAARDLLARAVDDAEAAPAVLVQTLISLAFAQGIGSFAEGIGSFAEGTSGTGLFFDESLHNARRAVEIAEELGEPGVLSTALAMWVHTSFHYGHGVDEDSLQRALELEDYSADVPVPFSASGVQALIRAWTGRLDEARSHMRVVRQRCLERGSDRNMMAVAGYSALIELWQGNLTAALVLADEAVEWAQQLGSEHVEIIPLSIRGAARAHAGLVDEARSDANAVLTAANECGSPRMTEWPTKTLGLVHLSLGEYAAAVTTFQPLVAMLEVLPEVEIESAGYLPDAAEAMIAVGQFDNAEPLIGFLESHGSRLDRSWMLAAGARCRAMLLAAQGDVDAAEAVARQAITEHDKVPMPFERARTLLLLGQLQRRRRLKEAAAATLEEALGEFKRMGAPLWADRVRAELARTNVSPTRVRTNVSPTRDRTNVSPTREQLLTPSEQRVAELAASGMTNKDIAAKLFISPKTVEHNIGRIYRKLGIRSRAELGRLINP